MKILNLFAAAIAINNAIMDRYDFQKPCYDVYIGLTCDSAFDATTQMVYSWSRPVIAPFARNGQGLTIFNYYISLVTSTEP